MYAISKGDADGVETAECDRRIRACTRDLRLKRLSPPALQGETRLAFPSTSLFADGLRYPEWLGPVTSSLLFLQPVLRPNV